MKLAENYNFGVLKEELILDRIVVGIRDKLLSERMLLEADFVGTFVCFFFHGKTS